MKAVMVAIRHDGSKVSVFEYSMSEYTEWVERAISRGFEMKTEDVDWAIRFEGPETEANDFVVIFK